MRLPHEGQAMPIIERQTPWFFALLLAGEGQPEKLRCVQVVDVISDCHLEWQN